MRKKYHYQKYWQSNKVLQGIFAQLSDEEKKNLYTCIDNIEQNIEQQEKKDIWYSLLVHFLLNKIEIKKVEVIEVTHLEDPFQSWDLGDTDGKDK